MTENACPPLGTGSVDFDALNAAAKRGDELTPEVIAEATTGGPPLPEPPTLDDKRLDELREIAEAEGVDTAGLRKKDDVREAIEERREAAAPAPATEIVVDSTTVAPSPRARP